MESKNENGDELAIEQINKNMKKKKPSRGMHMFSVVMFMLRRRRRRKSVNSRFWKRVVDPIQKVNSENTIMPPSDSIHKAILPQPPPLAPVILTGGDGGGDGEHLPETVEVVPASSASVSSGISGYGSAMSLRDLDYHYDDDDDDEDECYSDVEGGDDKIDEKAEEFIVKFYEQMKIQNQAYSDRCKAKGLMI